MFNINALTPDARSFFNNMPPLMQETLVQSGLNYTTVEELKAFERAHGTGQEYPGALRFHSAGDCKTPRHL